MMELKKCLGCDQDMRPWSRTAQPGDGLRYGARGLCSGCYRAKHTTGEHVDYPRSHRPNSEVIEEWEWLRDAGYTRRQAALRMGMTFAALDRAIYRAEEYQRRVSA